MNKDIVHYTYVGTGEDDWVEVHLATIGEMIVCETIDEVTLGEEPKPELPTTDIRCGCAF